MSNDGRPASDLPRLLRSGQAGRDRARVGRAGRLAGRAGLKPLVSSVLHRAEVPRAVWRAEPGALPRSYRLIRRIARVALTPGILDDSATLPPQALSPAHAIHLASALAVRRDLAAFVAYDEALLAAAADAGRPVACSGPAPMGRLRSWKIRASW